MKKVLWMMMALVLMCGCKQQTPEQIAQKQGLEMKSKVEKDIDERIKGLLVGILEHPDSYQPVSTDLSIVMNNMIAYDSFTFMDLRQLDDSIKYFRKHYGDNRKSPEAVKEIENLNYMLNAVKGKIKEVKDKPVEFEAIDAYHTFYVKDKHNRKVKRGYHFIVHKDNRMTLLCDHDDMERVKALADKLMSKDFKVAGNE